MRIAADLEILAGDALGFEHRHLLDEHTRVDHDAIADDRHGVFVHNARRHEVKRKLRISVNYRMARVVPALKTYDVIVIARDEVGDLALALIAPLRADQHRIGHNASFRIGYAIDYITGANPTEPRALSPQGVTALG